MAEPIVIQGGMGVAVSSWPLARAVSQMGQLGVVSGTGLDAVVMRRLQLGDVGGHIRRALNHFPFPKAAARVLDRYYIAGGKAADAPFAPHPMVRTFMTPEGVELCIAANFAEVYLAKENHGGIVGVNYMEKLQLPTLPSLFGAMLARVDYVLMGAGIPRAIPGILDRLSRGEPVELPLDVYGADPSDHFVDRLDPKEIFGADAPSLHRPRFLAIVSSATLAVALARKASGRVDGFVVEGPTAGGHNAPPRGPLHCNRRGEPIYGLRDRPDLEVFRSLGRPFWLAGSYDSPEKIAEALAAGAAGVQVGTILAFCEESGLDASLKCAGHSNVPPGHGRRFHGPGGFADRIPVQGLVASRHAVRRGGVSGSAASLRFGLFASVLQKARRLARLAMFRGRRGRLCGQGRSGGCNRRAQVSLQRPACQRRPGQQYDGRRELPLATCGDSIGDVRRFLHSARSDAYSAQDVLDYLMSGLLQKARAG